MGVCMSSNSNPATNDAQEEFSRFAKKPDERPPMSVEHQTYDYKQSEEDQEDETQAILCLPHSIGFHPDRIGLVDLDPSSETFCQIISDIAFTSTGDEPGRMNWAKSAEFLSEMANLPRTHLIVPCMNSSKIYVFAFENQQFRIEKEIKGEELRQKDISCPYSVRCLPLKGAPVHISTLGDKNGHGKGDFILIDRKTWDIRQKNSQSFASFGGDFSLQPRHNLLISTEWGHPRLIRDGISASELENVSSTLGTSLHIWQISPPKLMQTIQLESSNASFITTVRFLHNGDCNHAFACSAIGSSIYHLHMNSLSKEWEADRVVHIPSLKVDGWQCDEMPALLTDIVISMDDCWLYTCGFLHGIIWRFDIQDPFRVSLINKINLGGVFDSFPDIRLITSNAMEDRWWLPPETRSLPRGVKFRGGPGLLQLSKDGRRLYATNSFYKAWDAQFYPELINDGGQMVKILIDENDMKLDEKFLVDMKNYQNGPFVIRDIRFIDGDSTSDSFL